jgi:AsmA protein
MQTIRVEGGIPRVALYGMFCLVFGLAPLVLLNLGSRDLALSGSPVFAAPHDSFAVRSPLRLGHNPSITLDRGTLFLVDRSGRPSAGSSDPALLASGAARLVIDGGVFRVGGGRNAAAESPASSQVATSRLLEALTALNYETLSIQRSTLMIALPDGRTETLTDVSAEILPNRKDSLAATGTGNLRGQTVSFDAAVRNLVDRTVAQGSHLTLHLKSAFVEIVFEGRVAGTDSLQLDGQCEVTAADLRQTARWLGAPWPSGPGLGSVKIKGQLDWHDAALAFDRSVFAMDGNEATGVLTLRFASVRPSVTGTLALKALDLTGYLAGQSGLQRLASLSWTWLANGEISMPLSKHFDADVRISADQVVAGDVKFGRSAAAISLQDGQLLADIAELDLDGGRGSGQLAADLTGARPKLTMRGKLDGVDAGRATSVMFGRPALQGTATVVADLTATGERVSELLETVSGKLAIGLSAGGRLGFDLRSLMGAVQKQEIEGWNVAMRGQTSIDQLDARLLVHNGVIWSDQVRASAGDSVLAATGSVDLPTSRLDVRVLFGSAPLSPVRDAAAGGSEVLLFQGPWARPAIKTVSEPRSSAPSGLTAGEPAASPAQTLARDRS